VGKYWKWSSGGVDSAGGEFLIGLPLSAWISLVGTSQLSKDFLLDLNVFQCPPQHNKTHGAAVPPLCSSTMSKETIHSGHFMTSNPHTEIQGEDGEDDEDVEVDVVDVEDGVNGSRGEQGTVTTNASNKVGMA